MALLPFLNIFLSFHILASSNRKSSGSIGTTILKLRIHMDDELWYGVIENQAHCSYSSLYLAIFLSFLDKFVAHSLRN